MEFITTLWLPILLSAVFVFIASSVIHMVLKYHNSDFKKLPAEGEIMDALRPFNLQPGEYFFPRAATNAEMKDPDYIKRIEKGPVGILSVMQNGQMNIGSSLVLWFIYSLVISIFSAYIAQHSVASSADYLSIFRIIGTAAFMGYAFALLQQSIWYKKTWSTTLKSVFDGLIYALITAGTFGWLWP